MAFPDCSAISLADFSTAVTQQNPQFANEILREVAVSSPWPSVLDGGEISNNQGSFILNIAQGLAAPNVSLAAPQFTPSSQQCEVLGNAMQAGQLNYTVQPFTLRGTSEKLCVNVERTTVENALASTIDSLKTTIAMVNAADIANQMLGASGIKMTVNASAGGVQNMFSGNNGLVNQYFPDIGLPDAAPTFRWLTQADTFLREQMQCRPFNSGGAEYAVVLSGKQLQDDLFFQDDLKTYLVGKRIQGGYMDASKAAQSYAFVDVLAKGLMFGVIQFPQRFNVMTDQNGVGTPMPTLIEPFVKVAADTGFRLLVNSAWLNAAYEIAWLVYPNSFKRLAPRPYTGEGLAKFPVQSYFGELRWFVPQDSCNAWQDAGFFIWQIMRAFQPQRPHCIVPIAFKRCPSDAGLVPCPSTPSF